MVHISKLLNFQLHILGNMVMNNIISAYQFLEALTVVSLDRREGYLDNLMNDGWEVGAFKRSLKAGHLIEDTAKSPDVTLIIVSLPFTLYYFVKINMHLLRAFIWSICIL